ncbi:MAG: hypothetical protein Ct9H90mP23_3030 [Methanobacteriota archaeon]|nr:MAG: hypothetical protein Ct9H90mP23_3030 [Euryarchaeota archaeon]
MIGWLGTCPKQALVACSFPYLSTNHSLQNDLHRMLIYQMQHPHSFSHTSEGTTITVIQISLFGNCCISKCASIVFPKGKKYHFHLLQLLQFRYLSCNPLALSIPPDFNQPVDRSSFLLGPPMFEFQNHLGPMLGHYSTCYHLFFDRQECIQSVLLPSNPCRAPSKGKQYQHGQNATLHCRKV